MKSPTIADDIRAVQSVASVPTIMRTISEVTGLRFVCVARVTADSWTTCAVLDKLEFGLQPGDELDISSTLCTQVRTSDASIIIDHASDDVTYCDSPVPAMYGFESYFSVPVYRPNGEFFGTLCGLDPVPAELNTAKTRDMLNLFAELISHQLESNEQIEAAETALRDERELSDLREQFVAILGHDLRTPLSSIMMGAAILQRTVEDEKALPVLERIEGSAKRIAHLVDDVLDFTRGRMGSGIPLNWSMAGSLADSLRLVIAELESSHSNSRITTDIAIDADVHCDPDRISQLLANLLTNALIHGDSRQPVQVKAHCRGGHLTLAVSNGGKPIPEQVQARLFQPFWRGEGNKPSNGLGLGLYIASEIARAHGGELKVMSTAESTTFTFAADLSRRPHLQ